MENMPKIGIIEETSVDKNVQKFTFLVTVVRCSNGVGNYESNVTKFCRSQLPYLILNTVSN